MGRFIGLEEPVYYPTDPLPPASGWPTVPVVVSNYEEKEIPVQAVIHKPQPNATLAGTISVRGFVSAKLQSGVLLLDGQPLTTPVTVSQVTTLPTDVQLPVAPSYGKFAAELDTMQIPDGPHTLGIDLTINPFIVKVSKALGRLGEAVSYREGAAKTIRVNIPFGKAAGTTAPGNGVTATLPPDRMTPVPQVSWLDQELIAGVKNKWLALGAVAYLLLFKGEERRA